MNPWLRRVRAMLGMGAVWAALWALGGVLIGVTSLLTPQLPWALFFRVFDAPLPALALPGFLSGATFAAVLALAERHASADTLPLRRAAGWGALSGLLVGALPTALVLTNLATRAATSPPLPQLLLAIAAPMLLFSATSAVLSVWLAQRSRATPPRELSSGASAIVTHEHATRVRQR
jgi:hypothetical protein